MSARSVWSGTRPSRYRSRRPISAPPRRPDVSMRMPLAPNFIVEVHRLLHRAPERDAALELERDVLGDELRVELGLADLLDVDEDLVLGEAAASSLRSVSTSAPRLPIRMPGRAVWMLTTTLSPVRSITTFEMPAW